MTQELKDFCRYVYDRLGIWPTRMGELRVMLEITGIEEARAVVDRAARYYDSTVGMPYRFAKRWNKIIEKWEVFSSDRDLEDWLERMQGWNKNETQGKVDALDSRIGELESYIEMGSETQAAEAEVEIAALQKKRTHLLKKIGE